MLKRCWLIVALSFVAFPALAEKNPFESAFGVEFEKKRLAIGKAFKAKVNFAWGKSAEQETLKVYGVKGEPLLVKLTKGKGTISGVLTQKTLVLESSSGTRKSVPVPIIPAWLSLLPALLAIVLALVTREVLLSLLGGIFCGIVLLHQSFFSSLSGTLDLLIVVGADASKMKVIFFTLVMGAMVALISRGGGSKGIVQWVQTFAKTRRSGALSTWAMGLAIFFDDYASTLLVGNTMRPVTDRLRISREKLAYIIDSTAAPIASLAFISTWTGYEIDTLKTAMESAALTQNATQVFVQGLAVRFYPIYALCFVGIVAFMRRDFGPMHKAEVRAFKGELLRDGALPMVDTSLIEDQKALAQLVGRPLLAIVPICTLIAVVISTLAARGADASYDALVYGAAAGALCAFVMGLAVKAYSVREGLDSFLQGLRSMVMAVLVLFLAWAIAQVMKDLAAGDFMAQLVGNAIPAWSLSTVTFVLAALIALATGTSWGTMSILFPIVIPVVAAHAGAPNFASLLAGVSSSVLAGAVFGDHCSPISDTTVLSSIASASDHVDHTKTQAPYALLCGAVAILVGTLPHGLGVPAFVLVPIGLGILVLTLLFFGKTSEDVTL